MKISFSRLNYYRTCPRLYYWRFVQNLVSPKDPVPLIVGRATHAGLAAYYSGRDANEFVKKNFDEVRGQTTWLKEELMELEAQEKYVRQLLVWYRETYPTEKWEMLAPEVEGHILLPSSKPFPREHLFFFRADAVVSWQGHPWLLEHKTTSQLGVTFFRRFRLDGQISAYCYAVWKSLGVRPVGAIINAIRKAKNLDRAEFVRDVVMRSEAQIREFVDQMTDQLDVLDHLEQNFKDDKRVWSMYTNQCIAFHRTCDYTELCYKETPGLRELFVPRPPDYVDTGGKHGETETSDDLD